MYYMIKSFKEFLDKFLKKNNVFFYNVSLYHSNSCRFPPSTHTLSTEFPIKTLFDYFVSEYIVGTLMYIIL